MDRELWFRVERAEREKECFEPAVVLLTILKGSVDIDYGGRTVKLRKGEAVVINIGIHYKLRSYEDTLVGKCYWSASLVSESLNGRHAFFYCNTAAEYSRHNKELLEMLDNLTAVYAQGEKQTNTLILSFLFRILDLLVEHYQLTGSEIPADRGQKKSEEAAYMPMIMQYILRNLHGRVNLSELAEEMFVSTSTLSRVFRKNTGVYFADYVMQLRIREAAVLLKDTDQSMTQIAVEMGFSGSSAFSRAFKKEMGETPGEYRLRIQKEKAAHRDISEQEEREIKDELLSYGTKAEDGVLRRLVTVDVNNSDTLLLDKTWNIAINLGEVYDLTKANIQEHCLYLRDHIHFKYVRIWNVFSKKLLLTDGRTAGRLNFAILDQVLPLPGNL